MIAFDFAALSTPYRLKRCTYQMIHMCLIAESMGEHIIAIVSDEHLEQHPFMKKIKRMWVKPQFYNDDIDIYVAKADSFYRDDNWNRISSLRAFKVCLCNSDKLFRESDQPHKAHIGNPVQDRADLYMPANYSADLLKTHKIIPVAHPIDPRMIEYFERIGLYEAYLNDDLDTIRDRFLEDETGVAGFMGSRNPFSTRIKLVSQFPDWAEFKWARIQTSHEYIKWMMKRRGCIDMRGNGDKSLRFTEAAMLGRTLICKNSPSQYQPKLVNSHNCILVDDWSDLPQEFDRDLWVRLAKNATKDYLSGWSLKAQVRTIIERAQNYVHTI